MKNKKKKIGFTLIELLAVIIVLAIIALIATPIIFNVIENAKIKSLENSCYGVIDAVRTKYAEGLLNSEDGTVKLSGDVTDITVSGEQPIEGTWEIDNSSDSSNRGIKIKGVKFTSMKDYTCTNVNEDGTINSKVMCTKNGSDALVETDLSCFDIKETYEYEVDIDTCIKELENTSPDNDTGASVISHEEAVGICNNNILFDGFFYLDEIISALSLDYDSIKPLIDGGVVKRKIDFTINGDGCMKFFEAEVGEDIDEETLALIENACKKDGPFTDDMNLKEYINLLINENATAELYEFETGGVIDITNKQKIITGYTCDYKDIVIPEQITAIMGNTVGTTFTEKELTSVDFSKAKNLTIIGYGTFQSNKINSIDLSKATKLETIGSEAFSENEITDLKLPNNIEGIGRRAFMKNKITNVDFSKLTNLTEMAVGVFKNNEITDADLSNMKNLTIISTDSFYNNRLTNITIPNSVTSIEISAFENNQLTSVTIPNSVTKIMGGAFSKNPNLTSIKIDKEENSIEGSPWGASDATITWLR